MAYNLISAKWLPLARASGRVEYCQPWAITETGQNGDPAFVDIAAPRPDFQGALYQYLVGLLQTALMPEDEDQWLDRWRDPPGPAELRAAFEKVAYAFDLDGEGPRFMQEKLPDSAIAWDVSLLIVDQPESSKNRQNKDHFIKRGQLKAVCRDCLAASLFALQTNSPTGGRGHLVSLRGGGPLSTLVLGGGLWQTLWLAVLDKESLWESYGRPGKTRPRDIFPWLLPVRANEDARRHTPQDCSPLQAYWGMPRRIWLDFEQSAGVGSCPLCGRPGQELFGNMWVRPNGIRYEGAWRHPLSPYLYQDAAPVAAMKGQAGGLCYRHWLGITLKDSNSGYRSASVINAVQNRRDEDGKLFSRELSKQDGWLRVWAFGYDMDNKKARAWQESRMPLPVMKPELLAEFTDNTERLIKSADLAAWLLASSLKLAWLGEGAKAKVNDGDLARVARLFWDQTESGFFKTLHELQRVLEAGAEDESPRMVLLKLDWLKYLSRQATALFDQYAGTRQIERGDPKNIARAGIILRASLQKNSKKISKLLDLPQADKIEEILNQSGGGEA